MAKVLIENGADVNAQNDAGKPPLLEMSHHPEIAEYLISKGANPNLKLKKGGTVFTEGFSTFNATTREYTRVLVRGGADVNAQRELRNAWECRSARANTRVVRSMTSPPMKSLRYNINLKSWKQKVKGRSQ